MVRGLLIAGSVATALALVLAVLDAQAGAMAAERAAVAAVRAGDQLRPGDLAFRRGRSVQSAAVLASSTDARFSHVGVAVSTPAGLRVAHSLPPERGAIGGVRLSTWAEFAAEPDVGAVAIFRLIATPLERAAVSAAAADLVGLPFDGDFRVQPEGRFYCTQVALEALEVVIPRVRAQVPTTQVALLGDRVFLPDSLLSLQGLTLVASTEKEQ
ncbi:MAG: YiiX/YebB-like N1pC/P60 family cysteine hydrolase [Vicinamibacterales bacterium]